MEVMALHLINTHPGRVPQHNAGDGGVILGGRDILMAAAERGVSVLEAIALAVPNVWL